ncbi:uncharacterized protein [Pleurodeles waltl]|uniref:uncharacterized protein n=1 Tax=Pleurodeles waltl TaxID=8319 RepID=UPI003709AF71
MDFSDYFKSNEDSEEDFSYNLNNFIQSSVKKAVSASMDKISKQIQCTMSSCLSQSQKAHSAGESRKRKAPEASQSQSNDSSALMVGESNSHGIEDKVPQRPPSSEGNKNLGQKCKSKSKNVPKTQKIVIEDIKDTDDDADSNVSSSDIKDDNYSNFWIGPLPKKSKLTSSSQSHAPLLDSDGNLMFDPGLIHHPNSTEWVPSNHVAKYILAKLRLPLDKQVRSRLRAECPRPSLPLHITDTPAIDPSLLTFFSNFGKDPRKGVDRAWALCQDKVLDLVGPLSRIFDLAESARTNDESIDPEELSLWIQRAFCLLGNANSAMTHERRKGLLLKLDPKLANLAPKDPGAKADGLLFGDNFIKELSKYVTTFASINKAQQSLKKVFNSRVFVRAGRGRSRSTDRPSRNQGFRASFAHQQQQQQDFRPQFYPQHSRGYRGRSQRRSYNNSANTNASTSSST